MYTEPASKDNIRIVKESILDLVTTHFQNADTDSVDDVIVSYVFAAIDAVGSAPEDFCVHVDELVDIISAYIEEFSKIQRNKVYIWVMEVYGRLNEEKKKLHSNAAKPHDVKDFSFQIPNENPSKSSSNASSRSNSTSEDDMKFPVSGAQKMPKQVCDFEAAIEAADKQAATFPAETPSHYSTIFKFLSDMFPESPPLEVKHCVTIAGGDIESALATLIHRRDNDLALSPGPLPARTIKPLNVDPAEIKSRIINRYSYVDRDSAAKEHKPLAQKHAPKKLVRYRDNKIVSLKGERFTEVPKGEEEGVKKSNKKNHP